MAVQEASLAKARVEVPRAVGVEPPLTCPSGAALVVPQQASLAGHQAAEVVA